MTVQLWNPNPACLFLILNHSKEDKILCLNILYRYVTLFWNWWCKICSQTLETEQFKIVFFFGFWYNKVEINKYSWSNIYLKQIMFQNKTHFSAFKKHKIITLDDWLPFKKVFKLTFFLGPTSLRSETYFPSLKIPGTGPIRSPAGMLQSANTLTVVDARVPCMAWGEIRTMKTDGDQVVERVQGRRKRKRRKRGWGPADIRPQSDAVALCSPAFLVMVQRR